MTRLPPGRREVNPSRQATGDRRGPSFGSKLNISVPISLGLPLIAVGLALIVAAIRDDQLVFWIAGAVILGGGLALFASRKRL